MREYITFSEEEYFLLGRKDAITETKKLTDEIILSLNMTFPKQEIVKRLRNYLVGYRIGTLENFLCKTGYIAKYDFSNNTFLWINGNDKVINFKDGFNTFREEALSEIMKLELK